MNHVPDRHLSDAGQWRSLDLPGCCEPEKRKTGLLTWSRIRAKSRWTASFFLASFIRLQHWHWFFADLQMESLPPILVFKFPLATPASMLHSIVESVPVRYESTLKMGSGENPLVITPQWSNTFGPDCSILLQLQSVQFQVGSDVNAMSWSLCMCIGIPKQSSYSTASTALILSGYVHMKFWMIPNYTEATKSLFLVFTPNSRII